YTATDSPCEPLTVTALTPTVATEIHNASHAVVTSVPGSEEHTSELQSRFDLVCRPLPEKKTFFTTSSTCTGTSFASGTVTLDARGAPHHSASHGTLRPGSSTLFPYTTLFRSYTATDSPCEPLTVTALTPTVATEIHNASHAVVTSVP